MKPNAPRLFCPRCHRPQGACLCAWARPFRAEPRFVILLHPREARRTVGTARLVKLCLDETVIIEGTGPELDESAELDGILRDSRLEPRLLFPGAGAEPVERLRERPSLRRPLIVIVDGTWSQARKMIRTSARLRALPCLAFAPRMPSRYGFRRQPALHCLSTIEAVHEVISRASKTEAETATLPRAHDALLDLFGELVRYQTSFTVREIAPGQFVRKLRREQL